MPIGPIHPLDPYKDHSTLSFRDLVEAREFSHRQFMRKRNVIGTALGRYRQRKPNVDKSAKKTFANTHVKKLSWPCLLVFVKQWVADRDFGGDKQLHPGDFIPPSIEMPDGRIVPVCVIEAPPAKMTPPEPVNPVFPANWIGGGYPVIADVQGQEHVASIGGMLTDGHLVYAVTNRHVTGAPGEVVYSIIGGERVAIGRSSRKQVSRMQFEKAYPGWPGKDVFVHMDIGLIEVDDATRWTAQVYGVGKTGSMIDLNTDNFSLSLIDCPVRAFGCAAGPMHGRILGMFYRYQAVGGSEYIADFIIGPDGDKPFSTHHGDSGTLWLLDTNEHEQGLRPLAIQWGGQVLNNGTGRHQQPFALATTLSTVCRELDVDFVQDWNIGQFEYWGAVGHYTIASIACDIVQDPQLRKLMQANASSITFPAAKIVPKEMQGLSTHSFVPLADVPDMVWKVGPFKRGGMTSPEHANHFADMDRPDSKGKTLLEICEASKSNIDPAVWKRYYSDPKVRDKSNGLLPFRCWQIYDEMVDAVKKRDATRFVCAAGILSHYVGDACQPLHISYMFNGDPDKTEKVQVTKKGVTTEVVQPVAHGVHSAYEDGLVNFHAADIMTALQRIFPDQNHAQPLNKNHGFGAAEAVVGLMQETFQAIKPAEIVAAYTPIKKLKPRDIADHLWQQFGRATVTVMANGARTLAMLWDSAWNEGGGAAGIVPKQPIAPSAFKDLYTKPKFLESLTLDQIGAVLKGKPPAVRNRASQAKTTKAGPTRPRKRASAAISSRKTAKSRRP